MSLDVYLYKTLMIDHTCPSCNHVSLVSTSTGEQLYWANITHNLGNMAEKAGIYQALWRPEEINAIYAKDIIPLLKKGLASLKKRRNHYEQFNAPNGWGTYEHFVPFVEKYLEVCVEEPDSTIHISR